MKGFFEFGSPMVALAIGGSEVKMLLDTGFTGFLMLPHSIIKELALDQIGVSDYLTASGSSHLAKVYIGRVSFLGGEVEVPVLSNDAGFALAGMELFSNSRILLEKPTGLVEVTMA